MSDTAQAGASSAPAARPIVVGDFVPGSPEWHTARANGIGGSEIAAVLGLSPHESRFSLWHRKKGLVGPVEQNPVMHWGTVLEPVIATEYANRHPEWDMRPSPTVAAATRPWQIANPDRLLASHDGGPYELLEIKTARDAEGWGDEGTGQIPVYYRCQTLWYLDVLQLARCHVAVLIAGSDYREYVVDYDPTEAQLLRDAGARFMHDLEHDIRPDIDGHTATYQTVRNLPEGLDPVDVEIPAELAARWDAAQDAAWAAEDEHTTVRGLLLDAIGTGQRAVCEGRRIATRTVRDGHTYQLLPARTRRNAA